MKFARLAGILSVSLLAAACTGAEDSTPEDNPPPAATPAPSPDTAVRGTPLVIDSTATSTTTHN
ncbi:MAG: hypothetical protein WEE89_21375 [Gemmatimonadota bacterium]